MYPSYLFIHASISRLASFATTPGASVFIHWLVGMVYVFYFASFVILLREVCIHNFTSKCMPKYYFIEMNACKGSLHSKVTEK